jgi:hypothetical protein
MKFEKSPTTPAVFVAEVRVGRWSVMLRVDAREKPVRVDAAKPLEPFWQAIDNGGFNTTTDAKAFASRWLRAAKEQATLSPRLTPSA